MNFVLSSISPLPRFHLTTSARHAYVQGLPNGPAIAFGATGPMLKIHRTSGRTVVFTISGQLDADNVSELCQLVDAEPAGSVLVLDLTDLVLADRNAVHLLRQYEASGRVVLRNCPAYVRTWMGGRA